ncbi:hypothetical protein PS634_05389 [Pseudomonas fluorescens]|nr:hypothetical protein PS634_05389 [Pseudomonas fluorescens]
MEIAEVEEVHVRRRVEAAQRPVQIDGRGLEVDGHALRRDDLHHVARQDVLLDGIDCGFVIALSKTGAEYRIGRRRTVQIQTTARRDWLTQFVHQFIKLLAPMLIGILLCRIDQHDGVHLARQVVEHHNRIGHHQQDIGHAQWIRVRAVGQALLDITHAVITEITDQPAIETRQTGDGRHVVARLECFDERQRVFRFVSFDLDAIVGNADAMAMHTHHGAAWQTDDRIPPPLLAALHRLQQIGVRLVGQFQVDRQRCVEVSEGFAGKRNAVEAISGQTQEFFTVHEQPRGLRIKRSVRQTHRQAGQKQVRRANASGPGPS